MPAMKTSQQRDWDEIAAQDAEWAVLSVPGTKHGGWDREAFLATGQRDIAAAVDRATELGLVGRSRALDFGCGLGRLTHALAGPFSEAVGVDVSAEMVGKATALHAGRPGLTFMEETSGRLAQVETDSCDFIITRMVLQHLPGRAAVETTLSEMVRVLRPDGVLTAHLPERLTPMQRLQPRRNAYRLLRRLGVSPDVLYGRLGLHPMSMLAMTETQIRAVVEAAGGRILAVDRERHADFPNDDAVYWITK